MWHSFDKKYEVGSKKYENTASSYLILPTSYFILLMQTLTFNINENISTLVPVRTSLSLRPFIKFLKDKAADEHSLKAKLSGFLLEKLARYPELEGDIPLDTVDKYNDILELLYVCLSNITEDENKLPWALAVPMRPHFFYGTNAFYKLMQHVKKAKTNNRILYFDESFMRKRNLRIVYSFILERLYNFNSLQKNEIIHSFIDENTGLPRHFRINIDTRFIEIHVDGNLPDIKDVVTPTQFPEGIDFEALAEKLPFTMFSFSGVSIVTITDETARYAVDTIKNTIVRYNKQDEDNCYRDIAQSLKTLVQHNEIEFNLTPLFRLNNKLVLPDTWTTSSIFLSQDKSYGHSPDAYLQFAEEFSKDPKPLFYESISGKEAKLYPILRACTQTGIRSLVIYPLFNNGKLVGMMEIFTREPGLLSEQVLARLDPAVGVLAQLLQTSIDYFNAKIDSVIKEKFTSLQPAVQWKFNETAWQFLQDSHNGVKGKLGTIRFEDVFPLYGAIDIRNSTIERNQALQSDLQQQFSILLDTLTQVKDHYKLALVDELIYKTRKWKNTLEESFSPNEDVKLSDFLENEAAGFLHHFKITHPEAAGIVDPYFSAIEEMKGMAWEHRKQLEESIGKITSGVNTYLDLMKDELQLSYPCYFERFRTDGVEYDIYIGQSIAPDKPFDILYLKNLRLWQLSSMAAIARMTEEMLPQLPKKLQTTQLIFIHSNPIDISFRNDERRFDAEGGYNIRYQVIKKRIDKVHIANSQERLTQPGKIALVYFNRRDADEYITHIQYLQEQNILQNDLEFLDLEELQGVTGLKALRVGVNMSYQANDANI